VLLYFYLCCIEVSFVTLLTSDLARSSATAKSTARPSCLVGVLYDISQHKIC